MPVKVRRIRGRYRVTESRSRRIAKNQAGTAVDGGGYRAKWKAARQARTMNAYAAGWKPKRER